MNRCVPWTAASSIVVALLLLLAASASFGERARRRDPGSEDEADAGVDEADAEADEADEAGGRSLTEGLDCSDCHNQTSFKMASPGGKAGRFDHSKTGFPLVGRHLELGCMECHTPGRTISGACSGCHEDPHRNGLGGDCSRCHTPTSFHLVRPLEIHERTSFPLTGRHASADCTQCHQRNGARRYTDVPTACYACHEDDYRSPATHPVHTGTATRAPHPRDCSQCHRPSGWSPAIVDLSWLPSREPLVRAEDHDRRFPLSYGPHRGAPCQSCHVSQSVHRAVRCIGCHAHSPARLRSRHGARLVSLDGSSCLACHRNGSVP